MVRVKRRYIVVNVQPNQSEEDFVHELRDKISHVYGDFGLACFNRGFSLKKFDRKNGSIIICVRKGADDLAMSVLPLLNLQCSILCRSGTMRKSLKRLQIDYINSIRASIAKTLK